MTKYTLTVISVAAIVCVASPSFAAPAATPTDKPVGHLVYDVRPSQLSEKLIGAGFKVKERARTHWKIVSPAGRLLFLSFVGCRVEHCSGVRIRARWLLGNRPKAIRAARSFEGSVPTAFVSLVKNDSGIVLFVGRDVSLTAGRTMANLLTQILQVDRLAGSMTRYLQTEDPEITGYWNNLRKTADE